MHLWRQQSGKSNNLWSFQQRTLHSWQKISFLNFQAKVFVEEFARNVSVMRGKYLDVQFVRGKNIFGCPIMEGYFG